MAANLYIYIYIYMRIYIYTSLHIYLPCKNKRLIRIYTISIYKYYLLYINKYVYIYMMCSFIHGKTMKSWIKNLLYLSNRVLLSSDHSAAWHSAENWVLAAQLSAAVWPSLSTRPSQRRRWRALQRLGQQFLESWAWGGTVLLLYYCDAHIYE